MRNSGCNGKQIGLTNAVSSFMVHYLPNLKKQNITQQFQKNLHEILAACLSFIKAMSLITGD